MSHRDTCGESKGVEHQANSTDRYATGRESQLLAGCAVVGSNDCVLWGFRLDCAGSPGWRGLEGLYEVWVGAVGGAAEDSRLCGPAVVSGVNHGTGRRRR
jgi:hypothetical protein